MNSKRKSSIIWNFFTPRENHMAKCNFCNQLISHKTSITNLRQHVLRKHPSVNLGNTSADQTKSPSEQTEQQQTEQAEFSPSSSSLSSASTSQSSAISTAATQPNPTAITGMQETQNDLGTIPLIPKPKRYFQQQLAIPKKVGVHQKKNLDNKLLEMIVIDVQPFSIVENPGFRRFCDSLNPSYSLPSRKTLSKTLLPAKYLEVLNNTKQMVAKSAISVTLTTDLWTSRNSDSFMGVTAHFIDETFEIKSILLDVCLFEGSHTSINIASELNRLVQEWELQDNVLLAVTDNANNVKKAVEDLKWRHFGCLAHTINLIAQDGLKSINHLIEKIKLIVAFFKRSNLAKEKLDSFQKQNEKTPKKLIQSVPTRWNSIFYMLSRFLELKEEIRATLAVLGQEHIQQLTNNEFDLIDGLIKILAPLESATKTMSGEKYVTLSSVIVISNGLSKIYSRLSENQYSDVLCAVIKDINESIKHRFRNQEQSNTLLVSTFLDPRYKNIGFLNENSSERARNLVTNLLSDQIEETKGDSTASCGKPINDKTVDEQESELSIWGDFDKQVSLVKPSYQNSRATKAIIEIQRYFEEPYLNRKLDPLKWWKENRHNFPNLVKLVRQKFGTVSTSVPCERLFSKTGELLSERRSRLSSQKVREVMFIQQNFFGK